MIKFPIIKYFSKYFTPTFLKYSISANQITFLSLITGILACVCFVFIDHLWHLGGAFLLLINYILDNCDGEVARAQNQTSKFGAQFDTFVDWIIHTLFFSAIGIQTSKLFVNEIWFWMGLFGSIGCTINYAVGFYLTKPSIENEPPQNKTKPPQEEIYTHYPINLKQQLIFIFRELFRADFCFIVIVLTIFKSLWLLLPTAALGAHIYWILLFAKNTRH